MECSENGCRIPLDLHLHHLPNRITELATQSDITIDYKKDLEANKGTKDDDGKPKISYVDPEFIIFVAKVMEYGAKKKYERGNWQKDLDPERIINALIRHAFKIIQGEIIDSESGLPHTAHIGCNAMFLAFYERHGKPVNTEHDKG